MINPMSLVSSLFRSGKKYSLEDEILPTLIKTGINIRALKQSGRFLDIGIPEDYKNAEFYLPL
jgi:NDP-sugar pyrophosphorylase family protein